MESRKISLTYSDEMLNKFVQIGNKFVGNYQMDEQTKFVAVNLIKWLIGDEFKCINVSNNKKTKKGNHQKGIYIAGDCGTGKTLILTILRKFAEEITNKFIVNNKEIGFKWNKFHSRELSNKARNGEDLSNLYRTPILQIEDLGAEPNPVMYMGNKIDVLSDIIETREDNNCITLITSNLPPDYLSEKYNERLESRMMALNYFELNGDDHRSL